MRLFNQLVMGKDSHQLKHDIRFPLAALTEEHYGCAMKDRLYPVVIVCKAINAELIK